MTDDLEIVSKQAEELVQINRYNEALSLLLKVYAHTPEDFDTLCNLSKCFCELKEFNKSIEFAEKSIAADPDESWGYGMISYVLNEQGKKEQSLEFARKSLEKDPESPSALERLSASLVSNRLFDEAREVANLLLEVAPNWERSYYQSGNIHLNLQQFEEAEADFKEALSINPNNAEARNGLAITTKSTSKKENKEDESLEHLLAALQIDPNNPIYLNNLKLKVTKSYDYFIFVYLAPFFFTGFYVTPIFTIIFLVLVCLLVFYLVKQKNEIERKLSPEILNLIKARSFKESIQVIFTQFNGICGRIYKSIWLQLIVTGIIFTAYCFKSYSPFEIILTWALKILFWINTIWIFTRIGSTQTPRKSPQNS